MRSLDLIGSLDRRLLDLPQLAQVEVVLQEVPKQLHSVRPDQGLDFAMGLGQGVVTLQPLYQALEMMSRLGEWVPRIGWMCFHRYGGAPLQHNCGNNSYVARGAPKTCVARLGDPRHRPIWPSSQWSRTRSKGANSTELSSFHQSYTAALPIPPKM